MQAPVQTPVNPESSDPGIVTPIIFVGSVGIAAGDVIRLMKLVKRLKSPVRWRIAPPGVAPDMYLVHRFSVVSAPADHAPTQSLSDYSSVKTVPMSLEPSYPDTHPSLSPASQFSNKVVLDASGWYRGRPVCVLGGSVPTQSLEDDELAPLNFPECLYEWEENQDHMSDELVGARLLYHIGQMAWNQRAALAIGHLQLLEAAPPDAKAGDHLLGVIDAQNMHFHLREASSIERVMESKCAASRTTGHFKQAGFHTYFLELALSEYAKRCSEPLLQGMLPPAYLLEVLQLRNKPRLRYGVLGEHCASILRALETTPRSATELQDHVRLTDASLVRALTVLALINAIGPQPRSAGHKAESSAAKAERAASWWRRLASK